MLLGPTSSIPGVPWLDALFVYHSFGMLLDILGRGSSETVEGVRLHLKFTRHVSAQHSPFSLMLSYPNLFCIGTATVHRISKPLYFYTIVLKSSYANCFSQPRRSGSRGLVLPLYSWHANLKVLDMMLDFLPRAIQTLPNANFLMRSLIPSKDSADV